MKTTCTLVSDLCLLLKHYLSHGKGWHSIVSHVPLLAVVQLPLTDLFHRSSSKACIRFRACYSIRKYFLEASNVMPVVSLMKESGPELIHVCFVDLHMQKLNN